MPQATADAFFELAAEREGVFTAAEALDRGISHAAVVMAERRGTLRRLSRGVYQLVRYPSDPRIAQLWEATLWPAVRRGAIAPSAVISHVSALALQYALLEYTPPKVSVTIDPSIRIRRTPPAWLDVHVAPIDEDRDVVTGAHGLPVTRLVRTLRDCIAAADVDRRLIEKALSAIERDNEQTFPRLVSEHELREIRLALTEGTDYP